MVDFKTVQNFEKEIAKFFGAPYAVATDSCTHALEVALRHTKATKIKVPCRTYISVPFLAEKLGIELVWENYSWEAEQYYHITPRVIDAAVLWQPNSYVKKTFMGISFQYQKQLSLGRGGMLLVPSFQDYVILKHMVYDGRDPNIPWREQDISTMGYHYYMTPETAAQGLLQLEKAITTEPRHWKNKDWPNLRHMSVFKDN